MHSTEGWIPGSHITFRQVWSGKVWAVFPVTVVEDCPNRVTVHISPGTHFMAPQCGREEYIAVLAGKEWQLTGYAWEDTPMLWSQVPGEACSVWTIWKGKDWEHLGWKVNPETPWTRTPLGFDTTDHVLDVMVGPDLTSWKWKDEDEFSEAVGLELFSAAEAAAIRTEARRAHGELVGRGQRKAKEWAAWRPGRDWTIPALSPGWEEV